MPLLITLNGGMQRQAVVANRLTTRGLLGVGLVLPALILLMGG